MKATIKAISYYLPPNCITNEDLATRFPEWSVEKITSKVGISKRHIVDENTCASDLAFESAQKMFIEHNIDPKEIDFLLLCTQSPDYYLPTTACLLQDKLGIPKTAGALDFNLGCSGFVYGLSLAKGLIETGSAQNVLLITAETYSRFIHPEDKGNMSIFGDGAASALITLGEGCIDSFVFGTDGKGANNLMVKTGGSRIKGNRNTSSETLEDYLYMNGGEIFAFTLSSVPKVVNSIIAKYELVQDEIDLFIFHQANRYMLETLRKKLSIPEEKFYYFMDNVGNTVSSTIPIALYNAIKEEKVKKGSKVMLVGFGVGYSWAGCIINL